MEGMQMKSLLVDQNGTPYTLNHDCQSWLGIKGYALTDLKWQHPPPHLRQIPIVRSSEEERAPQGSGATLEHECPLLSRRSPQPFHHQAPGGLNTNRGWRSLFIYMQRSRRQKLDQTNAHALVMQCFIFRGGERDLICFSGMCASLVQHQWDGGGIGLTN